MSYTFSRREFLKYSTMTAVAVAGAGLLTGCEIQDPNNPVIKKLGYGTTLGTTGGLLKSVDKDSTTGNGVFTFTVKNNSDAPLHMATPNESFVVKVLDKDGNSKWSTKSVCPTMPGMLPTLRTPWNSPSFLARPSLLNSA